MKPDAAPRGDSSYVYIYSVPWLGSARSATGTIGALCTRRVPGRGEGVRGCDRGQAGLLPVLRPSAVLGVQEGAP